jgi:hypothetical protein
MSENSAATLGRVLGDLGSSRPIYFIRIEEPERPDAAVPEGFRLVAHRPHLDVYRFAAP